MFTVGWEARRYALVRKSSSAIQRFTPSCALTVSSNDPRPRQRNAPPDWVVVDAHHVQLRAVGNGPGQGRVYTIGIACTDNAGHVGTASATVGVPALKH